MSDLERLIASAAKLVEWPRADLRMAVRGRLAAPVRRSRVVLPRWAQLAALILLVVATVIATPWGRQAVADILEVAGIKVGWAEPVSPAGADLDLGEMVGLDEAGDTVSFQLLSPDDPRLGTPDAVYRSAIPAGGAIHMVWRSDRQLPAAGDTDVGILYSQFQVTGAEVFMKSVDRDVIVQDVTVRGNLGFWLEGGPHYLVFVDAEGMFHEDIARLAGNVLAWEESGVTHRIETTQSLEDALELADSLRDPG
ncbi:MAG TPA: hypothetical protein VGA97_08805 [Acidimicrobiia bacterium]